jgi:hypothetical protein
MTDVEQKIVAFLDKVQKTEVRKDTGNGYRSAKQVGLQVGIATNEARTRLAAMAEAKLIRRCEFSNGLFWSSINPLPWEPGGAGYEAAKREQELWKQPLVLVLVVQSIHGSGRHATTQDVKAYPEALRERAVADVQSRNAESVRRYESDRYSNMHLSEHYTYPPSYRLVKLEV